MHRSTKVQDKITGQIFYAQYLPNSSGNIDHDGNYIDNTLGRWSETYDYHLIRVIEKESFFTINDIFTAYRNELRRQMPWHIRWFSKCEF